MAKATGLTGNFKGKVGNIVGYQLKNSNNKVTLGVRTYVAEVSNPKTELQAIQRMKMAPAINFYRQLQEILDNAWQGTKYGTKSRQYFMSLAMKQSTGIPFIVKGDKKFYPGEYPVAVGSIPSQEFTSLASTNVNPTSIKYQDTTTVFGTFSQDLIDSNLGLRNGDKITVIMVLKKDNGDYVPMFASVNLDIASTESVDNVMSAAGINYDFESNIINLGILNVQGDFVAGAIIISRLDTTGVTPQWQRSNSVMTCSDTYKADLMGTEKYAAAIASYMASGNYSSDWYLNIGLTGSTPTTESGNGGGGGGDDEPPINP